MVSSAGLLTYYSISGFSLFCLLVSSKKNALFFKLQMNLFIRKHFVVFVIFSAVYVVDGLHRANLQ